MCAVHMSDSSQSQATLRELRQRAGVSAAQLARLAGVAPNTVLNAERGTRPSVAHQRAIAAALQVVLQSQAAAPVDSARADLRRCELELAAARARLEQAEAAHADAVRDLLVRHTVLWPLEEVTA